MGDLQGGGVAQAATDMGPAAEGSHWRHCNSLSSHCRKGLHPLLDVQNRSAPTQTSNTSLDHRVVLEGQVDTALAVLGLVSETESESESV